MPKVSVIMSVYNGQKYLKEAVDSILNQAFGDFEFIIVNDGSTDKTKYILAGYNDPRIKFFNQKHSGIALAKNKAAEVSCGEYIAIMDADDISLPERLQLEVEFLDRHKDIGVVSCSVNMIDECGRKILTRAVLINEELIQKKIQDEMCLYHCPAMIRRKAFEAVSGYRKAFRSSLDYDLFLRISEISKLANIERPLHNYRLHFNSISVAKKLQQDAYAELARRCAAERREHDKDRLESMSKNELKTELAYITKEIKKKNYLLDMYYYWAERFYLKDDYRNAFRYLCRSIIYRPFSKDGISLFLRTCFHLVFSQSAINKLKVITR